jgi:tetratricopeptide (TPR) repeat protein
MKLTKGTVSFLVALVLSIIATFLPVPIWNKLIVIVLVIAIALFINKATLYFIRGNLLLSSKKEADHDKSWNYYRKAMESGKLSYKYMTTAASFFIQQGDAAYGLKALDKVIEGTKDNETLQIAKIQKSMGLQLTGKLDEAISILEEVRASGFDNRFLFINLSSYYLYAGKYEEAGICLKEGRKYINESAGMADNEGWLAIVREDWKKAEEVYSDMMERRPRFPDPYVHAAQVKLHYGKIDEAIAMFNIAMTKKWNFTTLLNKEKVETYIKGLSDETTRDQLCVTLNASPVEVARGAEPKQLSEAQVSKLIKKGFPKEPKAAIDTQHLAQKSAANDLPEENAGAIKKVADQELPNTDLTEDDQRWLEEHSDD